MGRTKKIIRDRSVRCWEDPVTHEVHELVLDNVQKAFERVHQTIDGQMLKLSAVEQIRLVDKIHELLTGMVPHTERVVDDT